MYVFACACVGGCWEDLGLKMEYIYREREGKERGKRGKRLKGLKIERKIERKIESSGSGDVYQRSMIYDLCVLYWGFFF